MDINPSILYSLIFSIGLIFIILLLFWVNIGFANWITGVLFIVFCVLLIILSILFVLKIINKSRETKSKSGEIDSKSIVTPDVNSVTKSDKDNSAERKAKKKAKKEARKKAEKEARKREPPVLMAPSVAPSVTPSVVTVMAPVVASPKKSRKHKSQCFDMEIKKHYSTFPNISMFERCRRY